MIVMKFGGSSLGTAPQLIAVLDQIARTARRERSVVVVSAIGDTTDVLVREDLAPASKVEHLYVEHAHALALLGPPARTRLRTRIASLRENGARMTTSEVHAFGEVVSSELVAELLLARGVRARGLGLDPVVVEAGAHVDVDQTRTRALLEAAGLDNPALDVLVVGGFAGRDLDGRLHLLGRGGSDLSATAIGAAIGARVVELWKDVPGIFDVDPRLHPGARPHVAMSYEQARTLAGAGAQILHPRSMEPAEQAGIPVHVRPTGAPDRPGTWIGDVAAAALRGEGEERQEMVA